jgi:hypothetical protein
VVFRFHSPSLGTRRNTKLARKRNQSRPESSDQPTVMVKGCRPRFKKIGERLRKSPPAPPWISGSLCTLTVNFSPQLPAHVAQFPKWGFQGPDTAGSPVGVCKTLRDSRRVNRLHAAGHFR